ncbi:MAG: hypothetical protein QOH88_556 [Verrucomicrobiota bacterium]
MFALIFLIVFPFALWKAWTEIQKAKASIAWPMVSGTILSSEPAKVMFRRQPRVTYLYSVNGTALTSHRISFAAGYPPRETDAILSRYPVGKEVTVAYQPDNPAEATIETGSNRQVTAQMRVLLICFALIVLVQALNFYLDRLKERRDAPRRTYGATEVSERACHA